MAETCMASRGLDMHPKDRSVLIENVYINARRHQREVSMSDECGATRYFKG
jgi:hypothetical protein